MEGEPAAVLMGGRDISPDIVFLTFFARSVLLLGYLGSTKNYYITVIYHAQLWFWRILFYAAVFPAAQLGCMEVRRIRLFFEEV